MYVCVYIYKYMRNSVIKKSKWSQMTLLCIIIIAIYFDNTFFYLFFQP